MVLLAQHGDDLAAGENLQFQNWLDWVFYFSAVEFVIHHYSVLFIECIKMFLSKVKEDFFFLQTKTVLDYQEPFRKLLYSLFLNDV